MKTKLEKYVLIGCVMVLGVLSAGNSAVGGGKPESGMLQNNVFVRTASPAFQLPISEGLRMQEPKFKEIFRAVNPKTKLPITISIYELKSDQNVRAEFDVLRNKVMNTIGKMGFCSKLEPGVVETIADFKGLPAYSYDFSCLLKGGQGAIKTNLFVVLKDQQFVSLFGMTFGDIANMKKYFRDINL